MQLSNQPLGIHCETNVSSNERQLSRSWAVHSNLQLKFLIVLIANITDKSKHKTNT